MKKSIIKTSLLAIIVTTGLLSCDNSPEKKAEIVTEAKEDLAEAKDDVIEAKNDLYKAIQDSIADYNSFKTDAEVKIKEYDNKIAELKLIVQLEKNPLRETQESKVNEFTVRSSKLKSSIIEYNETGNDNWTAFKKRFNYEMNELEKAISSLRKNVTK